MISSTFFFLFSQLSVGMLLVQLFISPKVIGKSFFTFSSQTAAILMALALGFDWMFPSPVRSGSLPFMFLLASAVLTGVYNRAVHVEKYEVAFGVLVAAVATGLGAVVLDSMAFSRLLELGGWEHGLLAVNHLAATALLGSGMLAMVFGHWYLVVPNLSIAPLRLLTEIYIATIVIRVLAIVASLITLEIEQRPGIAAMFLELTVRQGLFFWPRIIFGIGVPAVLGAMVWSTVKIRHTQAATGLLYLVVVTLLFGEFFAKFLLFELRLPL